MATRFQLRRTAGWRKPSDGVVVARPSKWGNPYPVAEYGRTRAVQLYHAHLADRPELVEMARRELAGRDLGCWCPLEAPCHADVLLYLANSEPVTCTDCNGTGEITESVRVGVRKSRVTADRQNAMCLTCWGTGHSPEER